MLGTVFSWVLALQPEPDLLKPNEKAHGCHTSHWWTPPSWGRAWMFQTTSSSVTKSDKKAATYSRNQPKTSIIATARIRRERTENFRGSVAWDVNQPILKRHIPLWIQRLPPFTIIHGLMAAPSQGGEADHVLFARKCLMFEENTWGLLGIIRDFWRCLNGDLRVI